MNEVFPRQNYIRYPEFRGEKNEYSEQNFNVTIFALLQGKVNSGVL